MRKLSFFPHIKPIVFRVSYIFHLYLELEKCAWVLIRKYDVFSSNTGNMKLVVKVLHPLGHHFMWFWGILWVLVREKNGMVMESHGFDFICFITYCSYFLCIHLIGSK